jgi:hypothetical protein
MAGLDRDALLSALAGLNSDNDEAVASAGKRASALLADAGLGWNDVVAGVDALALLGNGAAAAMPRDADTATIDRAETTTDALALIERLLKRDSLYEGTRDELVAYRDDIAAGTFDKGDLTYLNALYARLMLGSTTKAD